jgi:hypothetical protein
MGPVRTSCVAPRRLRLHHGGGSLSLPGETMTRLLRAFDLLPVTSVSLLVLDALRRL